MPQGELEGLKRHLAYRVEEVVIQFAPTYGAFSVMTLKKVEETFRELIVYRLKTLFCLCRKESTLSLSRGYRCNSFGLHNKEGDEVYSILQLSGMWVST